MAGNMARQSQDLEAEVRAADPLARGARAGGRAAAARRPEVAAAGWERRAELEAELQAFAAAHPGGWNHEEWVDLLAVLAARGHDTANDAAIGLALERERLGQALARVRGLGERRRLAILERWDRVCDVQAAGADELARLPGLNPGLAQRVVDALR